MRNTVFSNKPITACYGCKACEQICAHDAIIMNLNEEGFVYPEIDTTKCVDCGLCEKMCPTQEANISSLFHRIPSEVFAIWNKCLNERMASTSGGAFYMLASKFIEGGGIVYGVDYRDDLTAYHRRVTEAKVLERLRGSKYMQSDINTVYSQVKNDLKSGKRVLFSGTPCQVAGLRLFLRKEYDSLYTIDLVCHGVPSPQIFKEHVKYLEDKYGDKLVDFKFRAKKISGWRTYVKYVFNIRKSIYVFGGMDFYSHAFHHGYLSRESCFSCEFSRSCRVADITLSDFWGAEKYSKVLKRQRKYGFNLVMCNTGKGNSLFNTISNMIETCKVPAQIAIDGDIRLREQGPKPAFRDKSYKICKEKGYTFLAEEMGRKGSFAHRLIPTTVKNIIREIQSYL